MPSQELVNQARRHVRTLKQHPIEATGDSESLEAFNWLLEHFSALLLPASEPSTTVGTFPLDAARAGLEIRRKSWPATRRVRLGDVAGGTYLMMSNGPGTAARLDWKPSAVDLAASDWAVVQ